MEQKKMEIGRFPLPLDPQAIERLKSMLDGGEAQVYADLARLYLGMGLNLEAAELLDEGLSLFPSNPDLQDQRAQVHVYLKEYRQALDLIENALKQQPDNVDFMVNKAIIYSQLKDPDQSFQILRAAEALEPHNPEIRLGKAIVLLKNGKREKGLAELEILLDSPNQSTQIMEVLGRIYCQNGMLAQAQRLYSKLTLAAPENHLYQATLGQILLETGNPGSGLRHLERAVKLCPENPSYHTLFGLCLSRVEKTSAAADSFTRALQLDPDCAGQHYFMGLEMMKQKNYAEAQGHLTKARDLLPCMATFQNSLAICLMYLGKDQEAIEELRKAISLEPGNCISHQNMGLILQKTGKLNEALDSYVAALAIDPTLYNLYPNVKSVCSVLGLPFPSELNSDMACDALFNHALVLSDCGKDKEACEMLSCVLEIDSDHAEASFHLGEIFMRHSNAEMAVQYLEQAVALEEDEYYILALAEAYQACGKMAESRAVVRKLAEFYFDQGCRMVEEGCYEEAIRCYRQSLDLDPELLDAAYNMGLVHQITGDLEKALSSFNVCIGASGIDPKDLEERIEEIRESIRSGALRVTGSLETDFGLTIDTATVKPENLTGTLAIVPVSSELSMRRGFGRIIREKAGTPFLERLDAIRPLEPGQALLLENCQGPFERIILAAIRLSEKSVPSADPAKEAFAKALSLALEEKAECIFCPPLVSGSDWFDLQRNARIMGQAIEECGKNGGKQDSQNSRLVIFMNDQAAAKEFHSHLKNSFSGL